MSDQRPCAKVLKSAADDVLERLEAAEAPAWVYVLVREVLYKHVVYQFDRERKGQEPEPLRVRGFHEQR